jgi:hypothetical protein
MARLRGPQSTHSLLTVASSFVPCTAASASELAPGARNALRGDCGGGGGIIARLAERRARFCVTWQKKKGLTSEFLALPSLCWHGG